MARDRKRAIDEIAPQMDFFNTADASKFLDEAALKARYPSFELMASDQGSNGSALEIIIKPLINTKKSLKALERKLKENGGDNAWLLRHH